MSKRITNAVLYNMQKWYVLINGTCISTAYSKKKAIDIAQRRSGQLFEQRKVEVVDSMTGEVIYQIW